MAGAECEGGMAWRREKEVVIHKALPDSEGLTPWQTGESLEADYKLDNSSKYLILANKLLFKIKL